MKYIIAFLFLIAFGSICVGYAIESAYSEKLIGFGVVGIFFIVFPLFSYYRWKGKKAEDYIINKENLEKMRNHEK